MSDVLRDYSYASKQEFDKAFNVLESYYAAICNEEKYSPENLPSLEEYSEVLSSVDVYVENYPRFIPPERNGFIDYVFARWLRAYATKKIIGDDRNIYYCPEICGPNARGKWRNVYAYKIENDPFLEAVVIKYDAHRFNSEIANPRNGVGFDYLLFNEDSLEGINTALYKVMFLEDELKALHGTIHVPRFMIKDGKVWYNQFTFRPVNEFYRVPIREYCNNDEKVRAAYEEVVGKDVRAKKQNKLIEEELDTMANSVSSLKNELVQKEQELKKAGGKLIKTQKVKEAIDTLENDIEVIRRKVSTIENEMAVKREKIVPVEDKRNEDRAAEFFLRIQHIVDWKTV